MPLNNPINQAQDIKIIDKANKFTAGDLENVLPELVTYVDNSVSAKRYGVTGVGGSSPALTRLWDSIGKVAGVGTDTQTAINHFDSIAPFNRRKCVGDFAVVNGKGLFTVNSYLGDPDFIEDGSMGNYVAVEMDPFWYYQDDFSQDNTDVISGTIGVSPVWNFGWKPHPICLNTDGTIRAKTYLPCYALAIKDAAAVSLPGYQNEWGSYFSLWTTARTYNAIAMLEPSVVRHYEWLLFSIEYATSNCQSIMAGATSMSYTASDTIALEAADTNAVVVTAAIGNKYVIGQTIYLGATFGSSPAIANLNVITNIQNCEANGTLNGAGTFRLITFGGTARSVTTATTISSRPWITGACNTVLTPSGSPSGAIAPSSATLYPCRYRYRENIWGNQYSTLGDIMAKLAGAGTGGDTYRIEWYYLIGTYFPADANKPAAADLATEAWIKLPQVTAHADGYIKTIAMSDDYPCVITPVVQTGALATTFYCDYAYIVNGTVDVRAVRLGGSVLHGSNAGLLFFSAYYAPSHARWSFGGGLFVPQ